jgi:hypothetical protein
LTEIDNLPWEPRRLRLPERRVERSGEVIPSGIKSEHNSHINYLSILSSSAQLMVLTGSTS